MSYFFTLEDNTLTMKKSVFEKMMKVHGITTIYNYGAVERALYEDYPQFVYKIDQANEVIKVLNIDHLYAKKLFKSKGHGPEPYYFDLLSKLLDGIDFLDGSATLTDEGNRKHKVSY